MTYCGLDFGTSNSTLGAAGGKGPALVALEADSTTLPSAIFFDFRAGAPLIGRAAIAAYVRGDEGRFMRSLKSVLGTDLIDQDTLLDRNRIGFRDVLARLVGGIKARAETVLGRPLDTVVHGRPVHFSIVRIGPDRRGRPDRLSDILANDGVRIGGTDFDRLLSLKAMMPHLGYQSRMKRAGLLAPNGYFTDLSTWAKINFLYTPQVRAELVQVRRESAQPDLIARLMGVVEHQSGHRLAMTVERAKIELSESAAIEVPLDWIEPGLAAAIPRLQFEDATAELASGIGAMIRKCLHDAGLPDQRIDAVFLTGGSTLLPNVRRAILAALPDARVVDGDKFGSVGLGLTLEAAIRYG